MKERAYNVILEGTIQEGIERSQVVDKLARLFKQNTGTVEKLLSGKPRPISRGLDWEKATKYQQVIQKTGAICRVEAEEDEPAAKSPAELQRAPDEPRPQPIDTRAPSSAVTCPNCGYQATSDNDVLVVRGDCPKCGRVVRTPRETPAIPPGAGPDDSVGRPQRMTGPYGERVPVSFKRRFLAGLHTFCLFWAVYLVIVYLMLLVVFPAGWIPQQTGVRYLKTAFLLFPVWISLMSMAVVSFLIPLIHQGPSWGQKIFGMEPLFLEETESDAVALPLLFRAAGVAIISFVPGNAIVWIGAKLNWITSSLASVIVLAVVAGLSWGACSLWAHRKDKQRGFLDFVSGTVQVEVKVEERPPPEWPTLKALAPLSVVAAFLIIQVVLLPLLQKAFS